MQWNTKGVRVLKGVQNSLNKSVWSPYIITSHFVTEWNASAGRFYTLYLALRVV